MAMRAGEVYEHPYERLVVRVGTTESDGRELVADVYVPAHALGVPRHFHPEIDETLTVVRGKMDAWMAGDRKVLGPGERLHVPRNTPHSWRPAGDEDLRFLLEVRPGARFEEMWRQFMGLSQDGMGPKGPGFLQMMAMSHEFRDVMAIVGPPLFVQRSVAALVAPVARLRGYKGRNQEYLARGPSRIVEPEPLPDLLAAASGSAGSFEPSPEGSIQHST